MGAFYGYGVAVKDFQNPVVDFNRNNTYIQSEGINQDFGGLVVGLNINFPFD